jgi:hypothetical protein
VSLNGPEYRQTEEDGGEDEEEYGDTCPGGLALVRRDGKLVEYSSSEDQGTRVQYII